MTVLSTEETLALGNAEFAIACARMPELAVMNHSFPDVARKIWLHGWLSGRSSAFLQSARMYEEAADNGH